jgi:hypothetical protein
MGATDISRGNQYPKREARGAPFDDQGFDLIQRDIDKLFRALADLNHSWTLGGAAITGITTSVGTPGVDTKLPTEQAVREAIDKSSWGMFWAFFMGGSA